MILGDAATATARSNGPDSVTIDDIFRGHARRRPDALALIDPVNRESFTGGKPRRLSYAEADRIVTAIAGRLRQMGLPTDGIIGIQLPNIVENILMTLAAWRAGMIVAALPLLCRRTDAVAALARIGAKALITCGRVGAFNHGQFAMTVGADVFSIRYVGGFGDNLPDGVVSFEDLLAADTIDTAAPPDRERRSNAAAHVAVITFDVSDGGIVPVARSHAELLAGGLAVLLESGVAQDASILSTIVPSSFAGLCLTLLPWALCGGTLVLHHPFDLATLSGQAREERCDTLIVPGPVAFRLAAASAFAVQGPASIIAAWRAPERLATSQGWRESDIVLVDVPIFGEAALAPARRGVGGKPSPMLAGPVTAPHGSADGVVVAELTQTDAGTVALRGPMVPHHSFPPGIETSGLPYVKIGPRGLVDSGYTCRVDSVTKAIVVTGPPSGIVSVGGYRFPLQDLQEIVARVDSDAKVAALPDPIIGQRLIGNAADRGTMQAALNLVGVNPLIVTAFRDRSGLAATSGAFDSAVALTGR
jgi:acyl-CoA synthetase (AMP-forming)/AMP-acid ligase II